VFHGGTDYRQNFRKVNRKFNRIVEKSIIQTADMLGLGAKNEVWVLPAVDSEKLKPVYERISSKKVIGHFPSSEANKNTDLIIEVIWRLKADPLIDSKFVFIPPTGGTGWSENIKRMSECDIYIEACAPKQRKRKYGEWGITALEAAALGKTVVTHFLSLDKYEQEYGDCALNVANSAQDLEGVLRKLIEMDNNELLRNKKKTRKWLETNHSYQAVGRRLIEKVYERF
jgi:hypothetical protein